ncbi:MAG: ABC transporter permease [Bacteroidales bacterium]|nr:ABC transporter permease [Bacteroidales bacterium]HOO67453.1 ABC transporter permease [Bacteroidales bacterium]HPJ06076.1 ABC transporter permease [Bacteroidales bacterium]HPQ64761.1 ABC transporter permease [Bacteroidales bacterium]
MWLKMFRESFLFAYSSVVVNKLRTFLSLFGITIGIVSIISVFTVFDWMEGSIRESIASLGDNTIYVEKWPWSSDANIKWWDMIKWPPPSIEDYEAVIKRSSSASAVCYTVSSSEPVKYRGNMIGETWIMGATHDFENVRSFDIERGRYFAQSETASGKPVAIIGAEVAEKLFDRIDPVGKEISIDRYKARVIGVFKKEGKGGISDNGMDEGVLVPIDFSRQFINFRNPFLNSDIMIRGKDNVSVQQLSDEITMILRAARRIGPGEENNFSINRATQITSTLEPVFRGINIAGWIIGGFSILVGGFGIANIMFVSVRERTSIIGIQMALGAKRRWILQQFLTESVLLSVTGGILGLIIVFIGTLFVNYFFTLGMYLTAGNIILAIVISATIGIIAGFAPASSASRMNPVEAIGYSF